MTDIVKLPWILEAEKFIGIEENKDITTVNTFWQDIKRGGYVNKPNIAWCSAFVGSMLTRVGINVFNTNSPYVIENSQYWLDFGEIESEPSYGTIVIFKYLSGGGHVGFVLGKKSNGSIIVLGGNQNDHVSVQSFKPDRVVGFRFPGGLNYIKQPAPILTDQFIINTNTR